MLSLSFSSFLWFWLGSTICTHECCKLLHWFPYWFWWIFCLVSCAEVCMYPCVLQYVRSMYPISLCFGMWFVHSGRKVFLLVPPSKGNLLMFEEWASSKNQAANISLSLSLHICIHSQLLKFYVHLLPGKRFLCRESGWLSESRASSWGYSLHVSFAHNLGVYKTGSWILPKIGQGWDQISIKYFRL